MNRPVKCQMPLGQSQTALKEPRLLHLNLIRGRIARPLGRTGMAVNAKPLLAVCLGRLWTLHLCVFALALRKGIEHRLNFIAGRLANRLLTARPRALQAIRVRIALLTLVQQIKRIRPQLGALLVIHFAFAAHRKQSRQSHAQHQQRTRMPVAHPHHSPTSISAC